MKQSTSTTQYIDQLSCSTNDEQREGQLSDHITTTHTNRPHIVYFHYYSNLLIIY